MQKYNLKRGFVALGLAGVMVVSSACSKNTNNTNNLDNSQKNEIGNSMITNDNQELDTLIDTKESKIAANNLLVLDSNYICNSNINVNSVQPSTLAKYRIIRFEDNIDGDLNIYKDIKEDAKVLVSTGLALDGPSDFRSYGSVNYKKEDAQGNIIVNQDYALKGALTLNSFLAKHNLNDFIKEEYTNADLLEIYDYLNQKLVVNNNYELSNLLVLDMSLNTNWLNAKGTRNYYIMSEEATRVLDKEYNKVINNVYGNEIGNISNYVDVKYQNVEIPNDYLKQVLGSLDIALTGGKENPQAVYF